MSTNKCCAKSEVKVLHQNPFNAVCLSCGKHWYDGQEYKRREWDALNLALEKVEKKVLEEPCCNNCACWKDGFCESGDSMEEGHYRHRKTNASSTCEAHFPMKARGEA